MAISPLRAPREVLCSLLVEKFVLNGNHPYLGAPNRQIGQAALQRLEIFAEEYRKKNGLFSKR
jgi:hypothetical protein